MIRSQDPITNPNQTAGLDLNRGSDHITALIPAIDLEILISTLERAHFRTSQSKRIIITEALLEKRRNHTESRTFRLSLSNTLTQVSCEGIVETNKLIEMSEMDEFIITDFKSKQKKHLQCPPNTA